MRLVLKITSLTLILLITACSVNPVTGEKELTIMSASQEVAMGEKNYGPYQQQQGGRYVVDPDLNVYINHVGRKLASNSARPQLPYEFVVLNSSVPNAWALPGGKIAINRGLLDLLDDEAQLAAVLSHEVVHAAARHTAKQMTQSTLLNVGLMAAGVAAQNSDYSQWIMAGAGVGANAWQAHYGRDQELQADEYGVAYMVKAGYNPQGAVELQEQFVALSKGQKQDVMSSLFASHPPSEQRVARNKTLAAAKPGGARNKSAFNRAVKQLRRDKPAYEYHNKALLAAKGNDFKGALSFTNKAIAKQPKEALFYITKGQLLLSDKESSKKQNQALSAFKKATKLNPEYYVGYLGAGLIQKKQKHKAAAIKSLEASMKMLPTSLASYHLGEYALSEGDKNRAISYFELAAQGGGDIAELAKAQLLKLAPPNQASPQS